MSRPTLYIKIACPWCEEVTSYLNRQRISYDTVVVTGNRQAMEEMVALSGQSKAPTLNWHGHVLADFGVEELVPFLRKHTAH
jgi:glutaredoxin 3